MTSKNTTQFQVPTDKLDRCESYIKAHNLSCALYTILGNLETDDAIEVPMYELDFQFDSFPNAEDAQKALETYVDDEVKSHFDEFQLQGFKYAWAYIERYTYEDGKLKSVFPDYVGCIQYVL